MPTTKLTKRLRIFAGPNGSGKSTIIEAIRQIRVAGRPIDFGVYINADDIARQLDADRFSFADYQLDTIHRDEFIKVVLASGLVNRAFKEKNFRRSFSIGEQGQFTLNIKKYRDNLAQILADFLRKRSLDDGKKVSFETVFSHPSKIEFMKQAQKLGYKNYLYFVSTETPKINISRIKEIRTKKGGHDVPEDKIVSRYYRSLDLLFEAAELSYQAYFFDNSESGPKHEPFAHFKVSGGKEKLG